MRHTSTWLRVTEHNGRKECSCTQFDNHRHITPYRSEEANILSLSLSLFHSKKIYEKRSSIRELGTYSLDFFAEMCFSFFFSYPSYVHDIGYLSVEANEKRYFIDLNVLYRDAMCLGDICGDTRYEVVSAHRYW